MIFKIIVILLIIILLFILPVALFFYTQIGALPDSKRFESLDYFKNGAFVNEESVQHFKSKGAFTSKLYRMLFSKGERPSEPIVVIPRRGDSFPSTPDSFSVTWGGHSTLIFDLDATRFITDPIFGHAAPFPFLMERFSESPFQLHDLPHLDFILISHDHYDHLEKTTIQTLKNKKMPLICPLGVGARLESWGIEKERIIELGWNDSIMIKNLTITAVTTRHFSGRSLYDRNKTLWNAYIISSPTYKIFFAGDGGYGKHFKKIGDANGPFDLTCLEIGAWSDSWPNSHQFPEEALQAHHDLKGKKMLPIHYAAYDLSFHAWDIPLKRLLKASEKMKIDFVIPHQGKTVKLDSKN